MRTRLHPDALLLVAVLAAVAVVAAVAASRGHGRAAPAAAPAFTWRGLVGDVRPPLSLGQRMIVVLRAPSLAERLAGVRAPTRAQERRWTSAAYAAQHAVLTMLAAHGLGVRPDYTYARVLDGFSAALDPRAVALLEADPAVRGVYAVRGAFPATIAARSMRPATIPPVALPGFDGRGVTIALLDTGVDRSQPYLHGRVVRGIDVVGGEKAAAAAPDPQDPSRREQHGTELAGLLVGENGPFGAHGVAPGARVLPIRVAGWQPDATGRDVVYGRSDQLVAGLERAVDPNGDGDTHDAVRVAALGVAEPFAAFADAPEAQAVAGATALDTLVVAPAGNDGPAGPSFGSIAGPGGAPAALTVGASDGRAAQPAARVVLRRGLDVVYAATLPVLGTAAPTHSAALQVGAPRTAASEPLTARDFFDRRGLSLVAGRAALVAAGDDPAAAAAAAAAAGAKAVLLYAPALPAGPLDLPADVDVPVVAVPAGPALALLAARKLGVGVGVALGAVRLGANEDAGRLAVFSSRGLAFDGLVKPDVVAPGVGLLTAAPGGAVAGEPSFATVNGTSAAAAIVAGAAALLAQARPALRAAALKSLLVGYARDVAAATRAAQGAGAVDVGRSAAGELVADPVSLAFGRWSSAGWRSRQMLVVRNVSARPLAVSIRVPAAGRLLVVPGRLTLAPGASATVAVTASARTRPRASLAAGELRLTPAGGQALRVPWAIDFSRPAALLTKVVLGEPRFAPSDTRPALLDVRIGRLAARGRVEITPAARLEVLLYDGRGRLLGLLTRQRNLLPGTYRFALTGRGPAGARLPPGRYELRLRAWPTVAAPASAASVRFRIE